MFYAFDGKKPEVGSDTYVSELAVVIGDVRIGNNCYVGHGAVLRGDYGRIEIGSGTAVEEGVIIHAPPNQACIIGEKVTLGHGAVIHASIIGDGAVIGMGAVVSIRSVVGKGTIVAEGAVVRMEQILPDGVVVVGNPARIARKVENRDVEHWSWGKRLYIDLAKKYLQVGMQRLEHAEALSGQLSPTNANQ